MTDSQFPTPSPDDPTGAGDPVVSRLRAALDDLTDGAEPNAARLVTIGASRRRWLLPAVAAAAVAIVVGVAVAVAGRGEGGTPAAPSPTGAPVTPAPTPAATPVPWYGLSGPNGLTATPPLDVDPVDYRPAQVWASPDYSRVLVVNSAQTADASAEPDDWPVIDQLPDPPSGVAWAFSGDSPTGRWHGIYWAPDDQTSVIVTGYGFSPDDLNALLPTLQVEHTETGPHVVSALSSLAPLPEGPRGFYTAPYTDPDHPITDGQAVALYVAAGGVARPLAMWGSGATSITGTTTPFGPGIRIETDGPTHVWWQVDGGPYWAGLSAPSAQIDDLLARVTRVADAAPLDLSPPDDSFVVAPPTTPPPATMMAPTPGSTPPTGSTVPQDHSDPTVPASTAVPLTIMMSAPTMANEPAMTAFMPSFPGGDGRPPIAVGESVMLSAAQSLGDAGITVYADEASQARDIATELERLRDIDAFGDVVIIQAGTNGTVTAADLDRIMAAVADVERVVVLTVHADRNWIAPNNELIRALPSRYPNVSVVDWDQIATENPDVLTSDGIHVLDRRVYADAIASAAVG